TLVGGGYLEEGAMSWVSSLMGWRFHANGGGFLDRTVDAFLTDWQMGRMNSALGNLTGGALDKSETAIQALLKSRLNLAFAKPMVGHLAAAGVGLAALFPSVAEAMTTQGSALNLSPWYSLFVATGLFLPALGMAKMKFPDTTTASPDFMTGGNGRHNKEATFLAKCIAKRLKEEHGIEVELTELQKKVHQEFGVGNKENSRGSYNGNVPKEKWPEIIDSLTSYYSGKKQSEASMEYAGQAVSSNIYVELVKQAPVDSELRKTWKAMSPEKQSDLAKEIQQPLESAVQNILEMYGYPSLQEVEPDMMFMVMEEIAVCRDKIYAEKLGHSGEKGIYQATSNVSGWKAAGGWAALGVGIKGMFSPESAHALEKGAQEAISGDGALNFILSGPGILAIAAGLYLIYKIFPKPILERKYEVLEANFRKVAVEKGVSLNGWQAPYRKLVLNLIQGRFLILPNMEEIHGLLLENYRKALGVGISQSEFFQYFLKLTDKNVVDSMDQSHRSGYIRGILYNFQNYLPSFQGHPWAFEKISDTLQQIFLHFKDRASVPEFQEVAMALVSPQVLAAFDGNAEQIRSFAEAVRNFTTRDFGLINLQQILPALRRFGVEAGRLAEVFLGIKQTRSLNNAAPGLRELLAHSSDFNAVADNELVFFILPNSTYEHLQQSPGLWNYLVGMDKNQAFKTWNDMAPNERLANRLFGVSGEQLKTIGNVVQVPRADARNMSHSRTYHFFLTKPSNRPFFERFFHQFVLGDHWVRLALGEIMGGRAKFHFMEMIPALPNSIFSIDAPVTATFFDIVEILKKDRSRTSYQVGDQLVPVEDLAALWELEDPEYAPPASIRFLSLPEKLAQASAQGGPLIQELFQDAHIKFSGKGIQITLAKPLTTSQREEVLKEIHAQESVLKGLFWEIQFQPKPPMVETMDTIPDGVVNIKDLAEFTHAKGFTLKIQEP
ncbi:MAG: hypothetical protein K8R69_08895, partial [Deltaproteobacteria bacterium]|nr:hypothetical protein [Deltaproteobacteria bacterium]